MWEATGLQGDSGAFPTFRQCGQLHQSGQLQPTRPRLQGGAHSVHCTSVHKCTHLNTCFRYVHILSTAQLLLNVFIWRHCGDLQCAVATWTLWTLCTLFDGDSSNSRDTLDTAVDNGLQCESWLFCALAKIFCKNLLRKSFAKIIPEIHIPKHPLPTPTEDCKWKRLPSPHRDILGKSSEKIFYLVSLLSKPCFLAWPNQCFKMLANLYPSWNEQITKNFPI